MSFKEIRVERGMTQAEVASVLGITRAAYTNIENGKREADYGTLNSLCDLFGVTTDALLGRSSGIEIPILGAVRAGIPIDVIEEILGYEEITHAMASQGEYFGLMIKGDSMEPKFSEGDVVIIRKQKDVDNGTIAVVLVNGNEATIKKIVKQQTGISLVAYNATYSPIFYTNYEIEQLPVIILGKVVELRCKF